MAVFGLLTYQNTQMNIESTNDKLHTAPAITYSECYQQCFCSDNLELLKSQPNESVNMIYCDILYGTGRNFGDFSMNGMKMNGQDLTTI